MASLCMIGLPHHEFWPQWTIYSPVYARYVINSFKARSMMYPFVVNPMMEMSGFVGEDKFQILKALPSSVIPETQLIDHSLPIETQFSWQGTKHFVAKPNQGERGLGVRRITSWGELMTYHQSAPRPYIIQKYIDMPFEFGVFFVRTPTKPLGVISSLCLKDPIHVRGDGISSLRELCAQHPRFTKQIQRLENLITPNQWSEVIPDGETFSIDFIRNHRRGSCFRDARHLITQEMEAAFQKLLPESLGFNYGRIDLRAHSIEDFQKGQNFKILEINGVTSEPGEIYDPQMGLRESVSILKNHWEYVYEIGHAKLAQLEKRPKIRDVYSMLKEAITRPAFLDR